MRGRKIMGGLVPYGKVWRTGANPATTLITKANLKIGTLDVPAGTYTIYTLPNEDQWLLIVNKQTGQWGTVYHEDQDLGRTPWNTRHFQSRRKRCRSLSSIPKETPPNCTSNGRRRTNM